MAFIWDLEWGKLISRCGRGAGSKSGSILSAVSFAGPEDEFVLTNCLDGEPNITVWYIGHKAEPVAWALPLHELASHSSPLTYMQVSFALE